MTRAEATEIVAGMAAKWPHRPLGDAPLAQFFSDLRGFDQPDVAAAVESLYREGREFPPTGAQVRARLLELDRDMPDWATVRRTLDRLLGAGWGGPYHAFPANVERYERQLAEMPPCVRAFLEAQGARQTWATLQDPDNGPARVRMAWETFCKRVVRDEALIGLPGALQAVRRANSEPRPLADALRRALPAGDTDERGAA